MTRVLANLVVVVSLALLPWWGACVVLLVFLVVFDFVELLIYGLVLDILYGAPGGIWREHGFLFIAVIIYAISVFIRPSLKTV